MTASTLQEVVHEWNSIYYTHKKTHKGDTTKFYNEILDKLAEKYYQIFFYENKLDFKRDVRVTKSNLKKSHHQPRKEKQKKNLPQVKNDFEEILSRTENKKPREVIDEGSGLVFTLKQIEDCGLLEETYL